MEQSEPPNRCRRPDPPFVLNDKQFSNYRDYLFVLPKSNFFKNVLSLNTSGISMLIGKYSNSFASRKSICVADRIASEAMANATKRNRCGFSILKRAIARYDLVLGLNRIPGRVKSRPRAIRANASGRSSHVAAPK